MKNDQNLNTKCHLLPHLFLVAVALIASAVSPSVLACGEQPEGGCDECGPYYGEWSAVSCPALSNTPGADPTSICQKVNKAPSKPKITPPTYNEGQKTRVVSYDCKGSENEDGSIKYTVGSVQWDPPLPGTVTVAFSSTAYVNVTSSDPALCASPGRVDIATVTWNISPTEIVSECVATTPADRARTTIGVGESVNLSLSPAPSCGTVTWTLSGSGTLSGATYTAGDRAGEATITADAGCECGKWTITITVIQPSGLLFENKQSGPPGCPPSQSWIGFQYWANVYVQPATVNFESIQLHESAATAVQEGFFEEHPVPNHEANGPHDVSGVVIGKGSQMAVPDNIGGNAQPCSGSAPPFSMSNGTATWPIDWSYSLNAGEQYKITSVNQVFSLTTSTVDVVFKITKGDSGYSVSSASCTVQPVQ